MSGHAPGPWHICPLDQACHRWIVAQPDGSSVADCSPVGPWAPDEVADANACLIASAPELLALMQKLASECGDCNGIGLVGGHIGQTAEQFDYVGDPCEACADIRAVIAKATGEQP